MGELVRLQKILAQAGLGSRRSCEEFITDGRVTVDGVVMSQLGSKADTETQTVALDGEKVAGPGKLSKTYRDAEEKVYYAFNKPKGVLCTNEDPSGRPVAIDLVPEKRRIFCVGRLDKETEGLILLTNDGELTNQLTHPRYGVDKTYMAKVDGPIAESQIRKLESGVHLSEGRTQGATVRVRKREGKFATIEITISEGMNRQVRRMLSRVDMRCRSLKRVAIGPVRLGDMEVGTSRRLTNDELERLRAAIQRAESESKTPKAQPKREKPAAEKKPAKARRDEKPARADVEDDEDALEADDDVEIEIEEVEAPEAIEVELGAASRAKEGAPRKDADESESDEDDDDDVTDALLADDDDDSDVEESDDEEADEDDEVEETSLSDDDDDDDDVEVEDDEDADDDEVDSENPLLKKTADRGAAPEKGNAIEESPRKDKVPGGRFGGNFKLKPKRDRDGDRSFHAPRRDSRAPSGSDAPRGKPAGRYEDNVGNQRESRPWEKRTPRAEGAGASETRPWEKRAPRTEGSGESRPWEKREPRGDRPSGASKPWEKREPRGDRAGGASKPWEKREPRGDRAGGASKPWEKREPRGDRPSGGSKPWEKREPRGDRGASGGKPWEKREPRAGGAGGGKPWEKREPRGDRAGGPSKPWEKREPRGDRGAGGGKPWEKREPRSGGSGGGSKPWEKREPRAGGAGGGKPWEKREPRAGGAGGASKPWEKRAPRGDRAGGPSKPWEKRAPRADGGGGSRGGSGGKSYAGRGARPWESKGEGRGGGGSRDRKPRRD